MKLTFLVTVFLQELLCTTENMVYEAEKCLRRPYQRLLAAKTENSMKFFLNSIAILNIFRIFSVPVEI